MVTKKEIDRLFDVPVPTKQFVDAEFVDDESFCEADAFGWENFLNVKGIGPKTIEKIKEFVESDDPFGVHRTKRILDSIRRFINGGNMPGTLVPTHVSIDIPADRELVCYLGIVRGKRYYDAVEQLQKYTTEELTREKALAQLKDPHLLKYAAIEVEDEYNEPVRVRVSRWLFPDYAWDISHLKIDTDVVLVKGYSSDFGGVSIQAKELVVIEP